MNTIRVVFRKELKDGIRDRKAVMSAMLFPLFGPMLIYLMMTFMIQMRTDVERVAIPVMDADNAPQLIAWLKQQNFRIEAFTGDPEQALADQSVEMVLVIPPNFGERFAESRTAVVELVTDSSRTDTRAGVGRLRAALTQYSSEVAALRLIARGVTPQVMRVISVQDIEIASQQQIAARALVFVPLYIVLAAFVSGMGIAVDSTAGERERSTLESLLINPIERWHVVAGKWLAASAFAAFGVGLTLVLSLAAMSQVPLHKVGMQFEVTPTQGLLMLLATLPVALLATSLQLLVGIFAKSFKDAQSYIGLLVMLPMFPALFTMINPVASKLWMFAVPVLGQHLVLTDVLGGKTVPLVAYFLSALATVVFAMALVQVTARLFKREAIIFT